MTPVILARWIITCATFDVNRHSSWQKHHALPRVLVGTRRRGALGPSSTHSRCPSDRGYGGGREDSHRGRRAARRHCWRKGTGWPIPSCWKYFLAWSTLWRHGSILGSLDVGCTVGKVAERSLGHQAGHQRDQPTPFNCPLR